MHFDKQEGGNISCSFLIKMDKGKKEVGSPR